VATSYYNNFKGDEMNLTPEQTLFITAIVVPLITQILKLILAWQGKEVSRLWVTVGAFVIAVGLAAWWWLPQMPTTSDPMEFALALLGAATTIVGGATLIYNLILVKIFDATGTSKTAILKRQGHASVE
jgi:F0F1-type ATP synthase membrane subunit a